LVAQFKFGSLVLRSNVSVEPMELYELFKSMGEIELLFDFLKNFLGRISRICRISIVWKLGRLLIMFLCCWCIGFMICYVVKSCWVGFLLLIFLAHLKYVFKVKINDHGV